MSDLEEFKEVFPKAGDCLSIKNWSRGSQQRLTTTSGNEKFVHFMEAGCLHFRDYQIQCNVTEPNIHSTFRRFGIEGFHCTTACILYMVKQGAIQMFIAILQFHWA